MMIRADAWARRGPHRLAALLGVLLLVAPSHALAASGWQTFTHPDLGFTLSYPDGWSVTKNPTGIAFMAIGPSSAGVPARRMNVNVTHEEVRANTPVDQYDAQNESGLGMLFHGYQRLRTDKTVIDANPALIRYYIWTMGDGTELYQMQLVTIAGTHAYVVTGTTAKASTKLADELQLLVSILLTFRPH
ncbi:MAG TPA: DcrB-related protein [bacterium]|nr:DcrB-related protein [bacterium]